MVGKISSIAVLLTLACLSTMNGVMATPMVRNRTFWSFALSFMISLLVLIEKFILNINVSTRLSYLWISPRKVAPQLWPGRRQLRRRSTKMSNLQVHRQPSPPLQARASRSQPGGMDSVAFSAYSVASCEVHQLRDIVSRRREWTLSIEWFRRLIGVVKGPNEGIGIGLRG